MQLGGVQQREDEHNERKSRTEVVNNRPKGRSRDERPFLHRTLLLRNDRKGRTQASNDPVRHVPQFMFPEAKDVPTGSLQQPSDLSVSTDVSLKFSLPETILLWRWLAVFRAPVPKAAVHEHGDPDAWKGKIWAAHNRISTAPSRYLRGPQYGYESQFCRLVPVTPDPRHVAGPLRRRMYINHLLRILGIPRMLFRHVVIPRA